MRKAFLLLAISTSLFIACSPSKKTSAGAQTISTAALQGKEDGLSIETAVVSKEKNEQAGVDAEYKWIKNHYTDYKIKGQSLSYAGKKSYDIITIEQSDGKEVKLYFDITNFFGKF
jgi:hypothetical protein